MKLLIVKYSGILVLTCLSFTAVFAQKTCSDDLLKQATREANINKNYPKAIGLAKQGLVLSPDYMDIHLLLARLYLLSNQDMAAETELKKILKEQPGQSDALNYLINLSYRQNNLKAAIDYTNQYLVQHPNDKKIRLKKIAMLYEAKAYETGGAELDLALKKYPGDHTFKDAAIDLHGEAARNYQRENNKKKAISEYEKMLSHDASNTEALQALFNLNYQIGDKEKALYYADLVERSTKDSSIIFKKIDLLKQMGRYDEAILLSEGLHRQQPENFKVDNLYKEVLSAKAGKQLDGLDTLNAINTYNKILKTYPSDTISRNQLISLEMLRSHPKEAIRYIEDGLPYYPNKQKLELKKLGILQNMGKPLEAYKLSKELIIRYPDDAKIRTINDDLYGLTRQNRVGLTYTILAFDQQGKKPWNTYSAYYMRTEAFGSLIGRVNYADRNEATGYQFEVEAYPIHPAGYSYINMAYSNSMVFPRFKFSYSYFLPFSESWEMEAGIRYLNSSINYLSYTAALGKYFGKYWLNFKTFITPNGEKIAGSYALTGRYYFNDVTDNYLTAIAGYGFSPDDRGRNFEISKRLNLQSVRITLGYQRVLWKSNILGLFGTWNNQEYVPGKKRNEFDATVSFQHKF